MDMYEVVVLGSAKSGKSSLIEQFMNGNFAARYIPTLVERYFHALQRPDGQYEKVAIVDTAGLYLNQFLATRGRVIRTGDVFILVFSVTCLESWQMTVELSKIIHKEKGSKTVPIMFVGNKTDLDSERQIHKDIARKEAQAYGCLYAETSAKDDINVQYAFSAVFAKLCELEIEAQLNHRKSIQGSRRISKLSILGCPQTLRKETPASKFESQLLNESSSVCNIL